MKTFLVVFSYWYCICNVTQISPNLANLIQVFWLMHVSRWNEGHCRPYAQLIDISTWCALMSFVIVESYWMDILKTLIACRGQIHSCLLCWLQLMNWKGPCSIEICIIWTFGCPVCLKYLYVCLNISLELLKCKTYKKISKLY